MAIKSIRQSSEFLKMFNRLDKKFQKRILRIIRKITVNPRTGKPMRYDRKGTREVYLKPYRFSYIYYQKENVITLLDIYHKKKQ